MCFAPQAGNEALKTAISDTRTERMQLLDSLTVLQDSFVSDHKAAQDKVKGTLSAARCGLPYATHAAGDAGAADASDALAQLRSRSDAAVVAAAAQAAQQLVGSCEHHLAVPGAADRAAVYSSYVAITG